MGLVKITFDGSSVTSQQDADFNFHWADCTPAGVIKGLGGNCQVSTSNNYIYFQSGYIEIYGRRIYVQANTSIYITLDAIKNGYVCVTVDLSENTVTLEKVESSSGFPTLTQENLHSGGNKYQFPICKYTKTTSSLTIDSTFAPTYLETVANRLNSFKTEFSTTMNNKYGYKYQGTYSEKSYNTYIFRNLTSSDCYDGIGSVYLDGDGVTVVFSCAAVGGSGGLVYYHNSSGTFKKLSMQLANSGLYIEPSDHAIVPKNIRVIR